MTQIRPAGPLRPALLLLLATCAAGCGRDAAPRPVAEQRLSAPAPAPAAPAARRTDARRTAQPSVSPVDPAAMVFDTVAPPAPPPPAAPPEPAVRPAPPAPRPVPRPTPGTSGPRPAPPRPSEPAESSPTGSCDVRPAEGFCFAYTGEAWTPAAAAANCAAAPGAVFRTAACPTSGRIATCTFRRASEPDRELVYTTYAPADADLRSALDLARLACPGAFEDVD